MMIDQQPLDPVNVWVEKVHVAQGQRSDDIAPKALVRYGQQPFGNNVLHARPDFGFDARLTRTEVIERFLVVVADLTLRRDRAQVRMMCSIWLTTFSKVSPR